jgi:hypothetical protein
MLAKGRRDKLKIMGLSLKVEKSYIFSHLFQSDLAKFIAILKSVRQKKMMAYVIVYTNV